VKQAMINYVKKKKHDHFDTPAYAVYPLLEYIPSKWVIWEPTDTTGNSEIARELKKHGNKVISTSRESFNFLTNEPDFEFDCIITNPPYTLKNQFIKKCFFHGKRWAMLMPLTALEGVERGRWFRDHGIELLVLDRRVEFTGGSCWFNTSWFCYRVLPHSLMFAELEKGEKKLTKVCQ
jgi:hypothetical protein